MTAFESRPVLDVFKNTENLMFAAGLEAHAASQLVRIFQSIIGAPDERKTAMFLSTQVDEWKKYNPRKLHIDVKWDNEVGLWIEFRPYRETLMKFYSHTINWQNARTRDMIWDFILQDNPELRGLSLVCGNFPDMNVCYGALEMEDVESYLIFRNNPKFDPRSKAADKIDFYTFEMIDLGQVYPPFKSPAAQALMDITVVKSSNVVQNIEPYIMIFMTFAYMLNQIVEDIDVYRKRTYGMVHEIQVNEFTKIVRKINMQYADMKRELLYKLASRIMYDMGDLSMKSSCDFGVYNMLEKLMI